MFDLDGSFVNVTMAYAVKSVLNEFQFRKGLVVGTENFDRSCFFKFFACMPDVLPENDLKSKTSISCSRGIFSVSRVQRTKFLSWWFQNMLYVNRGELEKMILMSKLRICLNWVLHPPAGVFI